MTQASSAQDLYNASANRWARHDPQSLSDFTARPAVFDLCGDVRGHQILDLGCGEGYCARILARRGAACITGLDISERMIDLARDQEAGEPLGIEYGVGSALDYVYPENRFDLVIAVFLFNYVTIEDMTRIMTGVRACLRPGGRFVFSVPHPAFPFLQRGVPPFHVSARSDGYFSARDTGMPGRIYRIDGTALDIEVRHKTFADYMTALDIAGFNTLPKILELKVEPEHLDRNRLFFEPVAEIPLHLAVRVDVS